MNRVIKFRYWEGDNMAYDIESSYGWERAICNPENLMQYTGLKDKNGKEVYEGDIMTVEHRTVGSGDKTKHTTFNVPVEFYNGKFGLSWDIPYGKYRFREGSIEHFEVIGNIYEHPHLLSK